MDVKAGRVRAGNVVCYYSDYVVKMGLAENFMDYSEIDQVTCINKSLMQMCSKQATASGCSSCFSPTSVLDSPLKDASPTLVLDSPLKSISLSPQISSVLTMSEWEHFTDICSVIVDSDDCGIHCPDSVKCTRRRTVLSSGILEALESPVGKVTAKVIEGVR